VSAEPLLDKDVSPTPASLGASVSPADVAARADAPDQQPQIGILLVDDNRENLAALRAVLEPLGERLVTAESGEQALRALLREEIAVILLDVRMAGLDGLETARIIRARPGTRHIPIIFLTAQASEVEEIALAYQTGAVDYVIKPFEPEILRAKVSVFVELSRERTERVRQSHARADAEAVARTIRALQIFSDAALAHLELDGLVAELLERTATLFQADGTTLLLRDDNAPGLIVHAHRGRELLAPDRRVVLGEGALGRAAAERRATRLGGANLRGLYASGSSPDAESPPIVGELLVVPLVTSNEVIGMLVLATASKGQFDDNDVELLGLAADRMALAIDHVHRFAHGRQLVETLQRSLLPDRLPHHPRLELTARYLPSGLAPQIGGDWYDALELDADRTAVMIGDVVGHGIRAATTMSELRNALRAFAVEGHGPAASLHQLDRVVHDTIGPGMIATVLFLIIDARAGTATVARAGHPPAVLRKPDGGVRFLDTERGLPLGVDHRSSLTETVYPVQPGDTLLVFTDGLVERRQEAISTGFDRLKDALADAPADVEALCDHVLQRTVGETPSNDDVALLAIRFLPVNASALELTLAARPDSVSRARHALRAWLSECMPELDRTEQGDLELVCSEACSNVIRHAYGPVEATYSLSARRLGDVLELQIVDRGQWRAPRGRHGGRGLSLIRQLCDEVSIDRRADGTTVTMRRRASRTPQAGPPHD
jgi:serine phosphatase RsbU (regulator of sigma subunit)/DNA-binding response OmpR family regulator/anti-sigma regulatory factor (Ser/Thr protein kinase)